MALNLFDFFKGKSKKQPNYNPIKIPLGNSQYNPFSQTVGEVLQGATLEPPVPSPLPKPTEVTPDNLFKGTIKPIDYTSPTVVETADNWNDIVRAAYTASQIYGIHPAVILSQMGAESRRGTSNPALTRSNYFGYQAYDDSPEKSRKFNNYFDSINAYGRLITQDPKYAKAMEVRHDPYAMIRAIKDAGYATDPKYVNMITNTREWKAFR